MTRRGLRSSTLALGGIMLLCAPCRIAWCQDGAHAPPPSASKLSGSEVVGDPSGAIRALGSVGVDGQKTTTVTVPPLGGGDGGRTAVTPPGTTR